MDTLSRIPFSHHLGIVLDELSAGFSRCTLTLRPEHMNSNGVAHGGLTFTLADTCMGQSVRSAISADERSATVEAKMSFFRPVAGPSLRSESRVVHRGRSLASVECRIWAGDALVASATGTFAIRARGAGHSA